MDKDKIYKDFEKYMSTAMDSAEDDDKDNSVLTIDGTGYATAGSRSSSSINFKYHTPPITSSSTFSGFIQNEDSTTEEMRETIKLMGKTIAHLSIKMDLLIDYIKNENSKKK